MTGRVLRSEGFAASIVVFAIDFALGETLIKYLSLAVRLASRGVSGTPLNQRAKATIKTITSTGSAIMKSGPKNMPPPQPIPQWFISWFTSARGRGTSMAFLCSPKNGTRD